MSTAHPKDAPGRAIAVIVYGLYLGGIMTLVTLPLGALLAMVGRRGAAAWVDTHLRFQLWTFAGLLTSAVTCTVLWRSLDWLALPSVSAWAMGYFYFTFALAWLVGRCAVGVHRLMNQRPVDTPASVFFGGVRPTLQG